MIRSNKSWSVVGDKSLPLGYRERGEVLRLALKERNITADLEWRGSIDGDYLLGIIIPELRISRRPIKTVADTLLEMGVAMEPNKPCLVPGWGPAGRRGYFELVLTDGRYVDSKIFKIAR